MKSLFAALRFLTILPIPAGWAGTENDFADSVKFFPVVGLVVGGIAMAAAWLAMMIFPSPVAAVLIVIVMIVISGGLHLDGLADSADGFLSVSSREQILEIMKDSCTGAMGVIVLICVLLLKVAALAALAKPQLLPAVLLMPVAGRCAMAYTVLTLPYAKSEPGIGSLFYGKHSKLNAVWVLLAAMAVGFLTLGWAGLVAVGAALIVTVVFGVFCCCKIGGVTGDTLGAVSELVEAVVPLAILASSSIL